MVKRRNHTIRHFLRWGVFLLIIAFSYTIIGTFNFPFILGIDLMLIGSGSLFIIVALLIYKKIIN